MKNQLEGLKEKLVKVLAARPLMPRPFIPSSQAAIDWQKAYWQWSRDHEELLTKITVADWGGLTKFKGFMDDPYKHQIP